MCMCGNSIAYSCHGNIALSPKWLPDADGLRLFLMLSQPDNIFTLLVEIGRSHHTTISKRISNIISSNNSFTLEKQHLHNDLSSYSTYVKKKSCCLKLI